MLRGLADFSKFFKITDVIVHKKIMGNTEAHDVVPKKEDFRKELNISRKVSHKQFVRHVQREYSDSCLWDLPWSVRDSVALYERFDASFNCISDVPPELPLRLPHLSFLNLSFNQIEELPESIGLLFHLETFILNNNKLQSLPESFTQLVKLKKADLSYNLLHELPDDLGNMEALCKLNVNHNKLKSLPRSLGLCDTLSVILARNNRLEFPPQKVCNEGSSATIKYLRNQRSPDHVEVKPKKVNVFPRVRGNQLQFSVPNPQSAMVEYIQTQTNTTNTPSRIKTPLIPPLDATNLDGDELRDRILGLLYGAAIGDAIGIATDGMKPDECRFHYDPDTMTYTDIIRDAHRTHWKQGDWTTNFDQVALLLDSLVAWAGVVDELDFASRLSEWSRQGFRELGDTEGFVVSNTLIKVVNTEGFITDPHGVSAQLAASASCDEPYVWADNAALPRAILMGIPHFFNLTEVQNNAVRICKASHADPCCVATSVTLAVLIALILQGRVSLTERENIEKMISEAKECGLKQLTDPTQIKDFQHHLACKDYGSVEVDERGREGHTLKPLACALAALRNTNDFHKSITELLMLGGNSSCNACIAGALVGARQGYKTLPRPWLEGLRPKQAIWLNTKVNLLLDMMAIP